MSYRNQKPHFDDNENMDPLRFCADYAPSDESIIASMLVDPGLEVLKADPINALATHLIRSVRAESGIGSMETLLNEFSLSTREGLALMVLAESLLRIPDPETVNRLLEDKLGSLVWSDAPAQARSPLGSSMVFALRIGARMTRPESASDGVLKALIKRVGLTSVRVATRQAMRILGNHFVLGETIEAALKVASRQADGNRYSYDMLGEGARTQDDAERYFTSYQNAIIAVGKSASDHALPRRPGISVKLSALHPKYESLSAERVLKELPPLVLELAKQARHFDLNFTVDAEEADRLELSLDVIKAVFSDSSLRDWDGFGLAIQAYQKRAVHVVDWTVEIAEALNRRMMVRLVKGAYWDTEVKRAQERGLTDYPVFTHKAATDLNYLICAQRLLAARPRLFPQFATHNALTIATLLDMAGPGDSYEFQRLHGMGEKLYASLLAARPDVGCRVYAPVGSHHDLLAYLVRRLLENTANSSFVAAVANSKVAIESLLQQPQDTLAAAPSLRHPAAPLPIDLFGPQRRNSGGIELGYRPALEAISISIQRAAAADRLLNVGEIETMSNTHKRSVISPVDATSVVGWVNDADAAFVDKAMAEAGARFPHWNGTPIGERAAVLNRFADLLEERRAEFLHLLQWEAGKTLGDGVAEIREAVDFCRYYANQASALLDDEIFLPGPTGEQNQLLYRGRGVFVSISPWNFPLAIFVGQLVAALVCGNAVVAKPAPQTPLIAQKAVSLLHEAGLPEGTVQLVVGDAAVGECLVKHAAVAGVAFTGSTATAQAINRSLADKSGPIVPLIAETGGINAMIVDATALLEQVVDDVVASAFQSAGQRCSALRILCVQEDIADRLLAMLSGATKELKIGDPRDVATHIGPVIDRASAQRLSAHIQTMTQQFKPVFVGANEMVSPSSGHYIAPHIFELNAVSDLRCEVFGPVLHIVRWRSGELSNLMDDIEATGYGLTLGVHTRNDTVIRQVAARMPTGNIYVNRNMIGAVVGSQPFGGSGLSGTGPKAGGPNYLRRFVLEQVVSTNMSAAGGNASLLADKAFSLASD